MIYLCVWRDRHSDDEYMAFREPGKAIEWCKEKAASYGNQYVFALPTWPYSQAFEFYWESDNDDGPDLFVQKVEIV